ncbi:MAG: hypothetical protein IT405_02830 [Candidatus Yanofskybacteria bacterium]|nr:hypothetical protein [Candidatus Yanofskybacteria bacterium]
MSVYIFSGVDETQMDKMRKGALSGVEARELLFRTLTPRADWSDQHRCIGAAVEGGYAYLARVAIQSGCNPELLSVLRRAERAASPW